METESRKLLDDFIGGNDRAAAKIVDRYAQRLINLARSRLTNRLRNRIDPEDIVQSAYRSFFRRAGDGDFELKRSGDLWRLLAAITVHKTLKRVEFEKAKKRDYRSEENVIAGASSNSEFPGFADFDRDPTPDEAIMVVDELAAVMKPLSERDRGIIERRLQEMTFEEIAASTEVSESTVRRVLRRIHDDLFGRLIGE